MVTPQKVHGIDISHHQNGVLDMARAKREGLQFLYHKATEGATVRDANYPKRRAEARKAHLPFGAYHFARPDADGKDAVAEARWFMSFAKPTVGDLVPVLDFEVKHPSAKQWCKTFMDEVVRLLKLQGFTQLPMHYGPDDFGRDYPYLRWVPRYNDSNRPPVVRWDIWQFSNGELGVPDNFPGFGHVDLNVLGPHTKLSDLLLKASPAPRKVVHLHLAHISMQHGDTAKQQESDAQKIFDRAVERDYAWFTGTETGPGGHGLDDRLEAQAKAHGYRYVQPNRTTDSFIAVKKSLITRDFDEGFDEVIPGSLTLERLEGRKLPQRWAKKGLTRCNFYCDLVGSTVNIGAVHYLVDSRRENTYNWKWNKKLGLFVGGWAMEAGAGRALVFEGGDKNMNDELVDTHFGAPLTSVADELGKWLDTGHGPIDTISTYDADGRVKALDWRVYDDKTFPLNTDHYLCEADVLVRL